MSRRKVLVLGSGALKIGEAGEFDYSGSQALKALREEGFHTILVNPNIATIQTSSGMADRVYSLPVEPSFVAQVIRKERPSAIAMGFGGQTALNCGLALHRQGVLRRYRVRVLGTPIRTVRTTEDRGLFATFVRRRGLNVPKSFVATTIQEALTHARELKFPLMIRAGFALGGRGAVVTQSVQELRHAVTKVLRVSPHVLLEEYLLGWREIEFEIIRDRHGNSAAVCAMENIDPMGIHTGESIVVAPSQTLSNDEYHGLRSHALHLANELGIIGECNVQFALHPSAPEYRIIEVNARLSRSSALASKATGYPLAFMAAKLVIGASLVQLRNSVTRVTSAHFEPALDYVTVKIPRWDLRKFRNVSRLVGPEMKSVGEVMGIGRTFEEAIQKAIRMLDIGADGLIGNTNYQFSHLERELRSPTDERLFALAAAFERGWSVKRVHSLTHIQPWFLFGIQRIVSLARQARRSSLRNTTLLRELKRRGFSDAQIAKLFGVTHRRVRRTRLAEGILPHAAQIDTLAGEYPAYTNYLYMSYGASPLVPPQKKSQKAAILVLGSGAYKIGSSVEFDWCSVNVVRTLRTLGYGTIMVNCNPETVSTDYDECDRLYFEELTLERILDICDVEKPSGIIISVGGQVANNLASQLAASGARILGTSAANIHRAENRHEFSRFLGSLGIPQPEWQEVSTMKAVRAFVRRVGYPVLVRPSYVLSGAAMGVAFTDQQLRTLLARTRVEVNPEHPVVVSKFVLGAKELEIDAIAYGGTVIASALSEHVENAGVHSGDATIVFPAHNVYRETELQAHRITHRVARALNITGPFNIQFLAKNHNLMVIECNVRASRSFPFISKVLNVNFIELATRALLGEKLKPLVLRTPNHVGVKAPQFSFTRLAGADPALTVEMRSTGEVACFGASLEEAFLKSLLATGMQLPKRTILLSLGGDENKANFLESAVTLRALGYRLLATPRTATFLQRHRLPVTVLAKPSQKMEPNVLTACRKGTVDLFINTSDEAFPEHIPDDYRMRRAAVDYNIPLLTNLQVAKLFVRALAQLRNGIMTLEALPLDAYYAAAAQ